MPTRSWSPQEAKNGPRVGIKHHKRTGIGADGETSAFHQPYKESPPQSHILNDGDMPLFTYMGIGSDSDYGYAEDSRDIKYTKESGGIEEKGDVGTGSGIRNGRALNEQRKDKQSIKERSRGEGRRSLELKPICSVEEIATDASEQPEEDRGWVRTYYFSVKPNRGDTDGKRNSVEKERPPKESSRRYINDKLDLKRASECIMPVVKIVKQSGKTYRFEDFPVSIGRTKECELPVGGRGVSRRHAQLDYDVDSREFILNDLKSLNGVQVNGERVREAVLRSGDNVSLGEVDLTFYFEGIDEGELTSVLKSDTEYEVDSDLSDYEDAPLDDSFDDDRDDDLDGGSEDEPKPMLRSAEESDLNDDDDVDLDELLSSTDFDDDLIDEELKNGLLNGDIGDNRVGRSRSNEFQRSGSTELQMGAPDGLKEEGGNRMLAAGLTLTAVALFIAACFFAYQLAFNKPSVAPQPVVRSAPATTTYTYKSSQEAEKEMAEQEAKNVEVIPTGAHQIESIDDLKLIAQGKKPPIKAAEDSRELDSIEDRQRVTTAAQSEEVVEMPSVSVQYGDDDTGPNEPKLSRQMTIMPKLAQEKPAAAPPTPAPTPADTVRFAPAEPVRYTEPEIVRQPPAEDWAQKGRKLMDKANTMFQSGYGRKLLSELNDIRQKPGIPAALKSQMDSKYSTINGLVSLYAKGNNAYESGDKSLAFSTWASFMKEERAQFGGNTSYYSKQVNQKVVSEYMARAQRATQSGDYHHAYSLWEKAAKIDDSGAAQGALAEATYQVEALYNQGLQMESANINDALRAWNEILVRVPPGHEYHTKASSKLSWYDQWRN